MPQTLTPSSLIRNVQIGSEKTWYVLEVRFAHTSQSSDQFPSVKRISLSNGDTAWTKELTADEFLSAREILEAKDYARMVIAALQGDTHVRANAATAATPFDFQWTFEEETGKLSIKWEVPLERLKTKLCFVHTLQRQERAEGLLNSCIKELVGEVQSSTRAIWELEAWKKELQDLKTLTEAARKRGKQQQDADRKRLCKFAANALNTCKRATAAVIQNKELEEKGREEREDAGLRDSDREEESGLNQSMDGTITSPGGDGPAELDGSQGSQKGGSAPVWKELASPSAAPRAGRRRRK